VTDAADHYEPYDDVGYLLDELARFDRLLEARLATWWGGDGAPVNDLAGLYVSDEEVLDLLGATADPEVGVDTDHDNREGGDDRGDTGGVDARDAIAPREEWSSYGNGGGVAAEADLRSRGIDVADEHPERLATAARRIRRRRAATRAAGRTLRFHALVETFGLGPGHRDVLLAALAAELDPRYERVYGYLHDDLTRRAPTVGLLVRVLGGDPAGRVAARGLVSRRSPLRKHGLVRLGGDPDEPFPTRSLRVEDRVVDYLLGGDDLPAELEAVADVVEPDGTETPSLDELVLGDEPRRALEAVSGRLAGDAPHTGDPDQREAEADEDEAGDGETDPAEPLFVLLDGPNGSGRSTAAGFACAAAGLPLVRADLAGHGGDAAEQAEVIAALDREARLRGAALFVALGADAIDGVGPEKGGSGAPDAHGESGLASVVRALDGFDGHVFLATPDPLPPAAVLAVEAHEVRTVGFGLPGYEERQALWESVADLPADADPSALATTFRFTPGRIEDAVATARRIGGGRLARESLYRACRDHARRRLGSLAQRIEPAYTWDDIVLPDDRMTQLREVAARIRHRGQVYDTWAFGEKYTLGTGLVVLFAGPSGTGKTMATEILAGDAGLDLYKVDLAGVVSKYIGETEKNLSAIFDEAEGSDAVLLFDEADALFGKRSEVSDARDRYANIEVNYLLQRIEEHDGIVVLTTNFRTNIDDAFDRRIHVSVDFPRPDREARGAIWRRVFPAATPVEDLDVEFLSGFELTGGNIKNIALGAAFLAAAEDRPVGMSHVVRAARREFQKVGQLVGAGEFGEYRELIET